VVWGGATKGKHFKREPAGKGGIKRKRTLDLVLSWGLTQVRQEGVGDRYKGKGGPLAGTYGSFGVSYRGK